MRTDSREFEQLVARIQQQLAPDAEVYHDVKLAGRKTRRKRQVDVLVTQQVGQYKIRIIVECKDYARPVDVKGVEAFDGLLDDVGGQKGVLVCPSGFTATAKTRAEGLQIDLYSPLDTEPHKWQARVAVPALCDFRSAAMSFQIVANGPFPFQMPYHFYQENQLYDDEENHRGTALENAVEKWNDWKYPTEVGEHRDLPVLDRVTVKTDNGHGMIVPVEFSVSLVVRRELYFGQFPITELSGFKDELKGGIITNAFTVGLLSPEQVEREWKKIPDMDKAPVKPVLTLTGLICWMA